jgi:hypothetical protein
MRGAFRINQECPDCKVRLKVWYSLGEAFPEDGADTLTVDVNCPKCHGRSKSLSKLNPELPIGKDTKERIKLYLKEEGVIED